MIAALYPNILADHAWIPNTRERETPTLFNHASDHSKYAAEIVAIERELGANPKANYESVAARLDDYEVRVNRLETAGQGNYVTKSGDIMTGALTVPELLIGNINNSLTGIRFTAEGYIRPLENFTADAFKIQNLAGATLFEVPYNGGAPKLADSIILTEANHSHRSDTDNDARYWIRGDKIGHQITLSGYDEVYRDYVLPAEGDVRLTLDSREANHFKIRSGGANAIVDVIGIPPTNRRRGITIAIQNQGNVPVNLTILNPHTWGDLDPVPATTAQPGRDSEVFLYSIGEGDRWVVHPYYLNAVARSAAATYPTQLTRHWRLYGRGASTNTLTVPDELGGVNINLLNGTTLTLEGAQLAAASKRMLVTDKLINTSLQETIAIAALVRNITSVEHFGSLVAMATSVRDSNWLRVDALSERRIRARISSQTGTYENGTTDTPAMPVPTTTDAWTLVVGVKTPTGYGVYNMNQFAAGADPTEYVAFREFPNPAPTFDGPLDYRMGAGVVPRSSYPTTPVGLASFICGAVFLLKGNILGEDLMQLYRAIRQDMHGRGLATLPAPKI